MYYAYVRVSTERQSCSSQEYEIRQWASRSGAEIARWTTEAVSGTAPPNKRKLGSLIRRMRRGDILVCTEISRLGRNMLMIMGILNECAQKGVHIHTIKDNFDLGDNINSKIIAFAFALSAEIERKLISQRTKEALADRKAAGVMLGRPKGSFKKKTEVLNNLYNIKVLLRGGQSWKVIAARFGIHPNTLRRYLKGTDLK